MDKTASESRSAAGGWLGVRRWRLAAYGLSPPRSRTSVKARVFKTARRHPRAFSGSRRQTRRPLITVFNGSANGSRPRSPRPRAFDTYKGLTFLARNTFPARNKSSCNRTRPYLASPFTGRLGITIHRPDPAAGRCTAPPSWRQSYNRWNPWLQLQIQRLLLDATAMGPECVNRKAWIISSLIDQTPLQHQVHLDEMPNNLQDIKPYELHYPAFQAN